jgi:ribosomal protein L29
MELKDLKESTAEALKKSLKETEAGLRDLRSQLASHQLTDVRKVRKMRRRIAQIKTIISQKLSESKVEANESDSTENK